MALGRGEGVPLVRYLCKTQKSLHGRHVWETLRKDDIFPALRVELSVPKLRNRRKITASSNHKAPKNASFAAGFAENRQKIAEQIAKYFGAQKLFAAFLHFQTCRVFGRLRTAEFPISATLFLLVVLFVCWSEAKLMLYHFWGEQREGNRERGVSLFVSCYLLPVCLSPSLSATLILHLIVDEPTWPGGSFLFVFVWVLI